MTELTIETLHGELETLRIALVDHVRSEVAGVCSEVAMVRARVDGLPIIGNAIDVLQRAMRMLRAAINDLARTNITAGEVQALHDDLDRALAKQADLEARVAALEQDRER
jgi:hypothetical protein